MLACGVVLPATAPVLNLPAEALPATPPRRAAVLFVFVTVVLDLLALGIITPVLPQLVRGFVGGDYAQAALWVGLFGTVYALAQFFCSPVQGALSDRFGRRPVILLSNLGLGLDFVLMALANTLPLLFLGRVIAGVTAASVSTANAYLADVTPPAGRAKAFGLLGAAFGIGFVVGPALGGVLGGIDLRAPFWVAAGLSLCNFLYGWLVLPESLPPERRTARVDWRRANPVGALGLLRSYPRVAPLSFLHFLGQAAHYALIAVFVLYADYRYGWGETTVGWVLAAIGICNAAVRGGLVGPVVKRFGERRALLSGLACGALGFFVMGLAPSGAWFLLGVPFLALWGLGTPALQALISRRVPDGEQGRLQGAMASVSALSGIVGPWLFGSVFAHFVGPSGWAEFPGAAFLLAAGLLALALAIATRIAHDAAPA
jgi:DHA1 family tetracycline resistance protein-like MFS transporter